MKSHSSIDSLKIKAKLLQKAKRKSGTEIPLKDAYATIAKTAGYKSWKEMKDSYDLADILNPPQWSAQWKTWYSSYEEAKTHQREGEYLLPYRKQYFICNLDYLHALGLLENDSDLLKVGADWVKPKNSKAFQNLLMKISSFHQKK